MKVAGGSLGKGPSWSASCDPSCSSSGTEVPNVSEGGGSRPPISASRPVYVWHGASYLRERILRNLRCSFRFCRRRTLASMLLQLFGGFCSVPSCPNSFFFWGKQFPFCVIVMYVGYPCLLSYPVSVVDKTASSPLHDQAESGARGRNLRLRSISGIHRGATREEKEAQQGASGRGK